jgi:ketosteroid isomerase-like protein
MALSRRLGHSSIWHRQADGSWKAVRDIFNTNMPLAAPAEPAKQ